jgi:hypothetical protein
VAFLDVEAHHEHLFEAVPLRIWVDELNILFKLLPVVYDLTLFLELTIYFGKEVNNIGEATPDFYFYIALDKVNILPDWIS